MISFLPGSKRRPAIILKLLRTSKAAGCTPRRGTLASVPVERLGASTITKSSAEASGPDAARATPGASAMMRVSSRPMPLIISLSAAAAQHQGAFGRAGGVEGGAESLADREQGHEDGHDARHSHDGRQRGAAALAERAHVERESEPLPGRTIST